MLILKFIFLAVFLGLSAFFSASETALFSLDSLKLKRLSREGKNTDIIVRLIENPLRCLTTVLAGNTIVNIGVSVIITSLMLDFFGHKGVGISIGVTTFVLLVFGEVVPKTLAIHNNEKFSCFSSRPLYLFSRLISPFMFLSVKVSNAFISLFNVGIKKEPLLTEEEFMSVMEVSHRYGVVGKSEKEMILSILELTTTTAQEVMTPRPDIRGIDSEWDHKKALDFIRKIKHSKVPVYKDSLDNILGMIYPKDLFLEESKDYKELIVPVIFVPETKKIDELLKDFARQSSKIAIVVDEYGSTSGLVTLEDILEEVFGEIYDEFEVKEKLIDQTEKNTFRISGKTPIYQVNEDCVLKIVPGDYDTIAGFMLDIFGKIPSEGESIKTKWGLFTIDKVVGRRIKSIIFQKQ